MALQTAKSSGLQAYRNSGLQARGKAPVLWFEFNDISIDVPNGKIYYAAYIKLMRSNLDGSGLVDIFTTPGAVKSCKADQGGNLLFYTSVDQDTPGWTRYIRKVSKTGTGDTLVHDVYDPPTHMHLTGTGIYDITNSYIYIQGVNTELQPPGNYIYRCDKNGQNFIYTHMGDSTGWHRPFRTDDLRTYYLYEGGAGGFTDGMGNGNEEWKSRSALWGGDPRTEAGPITITEAAIAVDAFLDLENSRIWWIEGNQIRRVFFGTSNAATVVDESTPILRMDINLTIGKIYWIFGDNKVKRANLDGTNIEQILP